MTFFFKLRVLRLFKTPFDSKQLKISSKDGATTSKYNASEWRPDLNYIKHAIYFLSFPVFDFVDSKFWSPNGYIFSLFWITLTKLFPLFMSRFFYFSFIGINLSELKSFLFLDINSCDSYWINERIDLELNQALLRIDEICLLFASSIKFVFVCNNTQTKSLCYVLWATFYIYRVMRS